MIKWLPDSSQFLRTRTSMIHFHISNIYNGTQVQSRYSNIWINDFKRILTGGIISHFLFSLHNLVFPKFSTPSIPIIKKKKKIVLEEKRKLMYSYTLVVLIMYATRQIKQIDHLLPRSYQIEKYSLKKKYYYFKNELEILFWGTLSFIFQKDFLS